MPNFRALDHATVDLAVRYTVSSGVSMSVLLSKRGFFGNLVQNIHRFLLCSS